MRNLVVDESGRRRFVSLCQQLLALAVILAVLTPAARTVTMDVRPVPVGDGPDAPALSGTPSVGLRAAAQASVATVPTSVVDPVVEEYALTAPAGARIAPGSLRGTLKRTTGGGSEIVSDALPVHGYGAVGVTWAHGVEMGHDAIGMQARTRQDGRWTGWTTIDYHDEHGPDPDSLEGQRSRPGSEPLLVGEVEKVQVRVSTRRAAPADMRLAVIDPGEATRSARQVAAIDTADLDGRAGGSDTVPASYAVTAEDDAGNESTDQVALAAVETTSKPKIFSRAQWGADERMRDAPSLHYGEVHAAFVHHTVNANDYTRAQVPAILRGIYAYHTRSRGWSDVGYNFLVDRFGRIWEGRYGGVDRPVVGAHTLGYNENSFAMSAIGNFEVAKPTAKIVKAYGRLFAWKLSLHGVSAGSTKQWVASRNFAAINGHRDADSTACPGKYLYRKLDRIRELAKAQQAPWSGRDLESNLVGSDVPDIVVRRASDGRGLVIPLERSKNGGIVRGKPIDAGIDLSAAKSMMRAGDWDRDGHVDLLVQRKGSVANLWLHRGRGDGTFAEPVRIARGMKGVTMLAAVGDVTGDGWPDLMGRPGGGAMKIFPGRGLEGVGGAYEAYSSVPNGGHIPMGRWNPDGAPDSLVRTGSSLTLFLGNGPGGWDGSRKLSAKVGGYDWMVGVGSVNGDWHGDLITRSRKSKELWLVPTTAKGGLRPRVSLGSGADYNLIA